MDNLKLLVQTLGIGVAVVDLESWAVLFENARFSEILPAEEGASALLSMRLSSLNAERAVARLGRSGSYTFEFESRVGARTTAIQVVMRVFPDNPGQALVEFHDISKLKQVEYMLESYSKMTEKHTRELRREKERGEKLLLNIMPRSIYEEMIKFGSTTPQKFDSASVIMLDFVGFTDMAVSKDASQLVTQLNDLFTAFDRIVEMFGCERIKTIGDAYMAVSGVPDPNPDHAHNVARVALRIQRYLEKRNVAHSAEPWLCRIGINTGPLVGSIVGIHKYVYDIFGPGVNLAARMEGFSDPMQITLCQETYELLKDDFVCKLRGDFEVKGFGIKTLYSLDGELEK